MDIELIGKLIKIIKNALSENTDDQILSEQFRSDFLIHKGLLIFLLDLVFNSQLVPYPLREEICNIIMFNLSLIKDTLRIFVPWHMFSMMNFTRIKMPSKD